MITNYQKKDIVVDGEFASEAEFTIKAGRKAFKTLISNLYTDKVKAIITELSANAYDSHVAAGRQEIPFEISLPTEFNPIFVIRDFGTGMTEEFMLKYYTVAFYSSKETSNDYNGEKGLGRLSVLSLCESYVCSSIQNGVKKIYSVFINENGKPVILLLSADQTNEPDGFIVEIPIKNDLHDSFENHSKNIFKNFKVKPIIKSHLDFEFTKDNYTILSEDGSWGLKAGGGNSEAICSVYSYPIDSNAISGLSDIGKTILNMGLVAHFNIGDLNSSANREGLDYDERTIKNIKNRIENIANELANTVIKDFNNKSLYEKIKLKNSIFSYNGKFSGLRALVPNIRSIPDKLIFNGCKLATVNYSPYAYSNSGRCKILWELDNFVEVTDTTVFINCDKKSFMKQKALKFYETNGSANLVFIYPDNKTAALNLKNDIGLDLNTLIKASEMPFDKITRNYSQKDNDDHYIFVRSSYNKRNDWEINKIDNSKDVFYVEKRGFSVVTKNYHSEGSNRNLQRRIDFVKSISGGKDFTIIGLTEKQIKDTDFESFEEYYSDTVKTWVEENILIFEAHKKLNEDYHYFPFSIDLCGKINFKNEKVKDIADEFLHLKKIIIDNDKNGKIMYFMTNNNIDNFVKLDLSKYKYSTHELYKICPMLKHLKNFIDDSIPLVEFAVNV